MSNYRRNYVAGGTYFFTCVTYQRQPILTTDLGRECLRQAIDTIKQDHPFEVVAVVLLPDHWHTIWALPRGDDRYPLRWMRIKEAFTEQWQWNPQTYDSDPYATARCLLFAALFVVAILLVRVAWIDSQHVKVS